MNPITITTTALTALDDDGIAQNQTPGAAGNLTLNGVLVSGGVATLNSGEMGVQVLLTSAGDESGKTVTLYGTDPSGASISETLTGPNTTRTSVKFYRTITRVAVSAAFSGNVKVGINQVGVSKAVCPDHGLNPFAIALGLDVTGTVNVDVQHCFGPTPYNWTQDQSTWFDHSSLAAQTADADGNYAFPVSAIRLLVNSGGGTASLYIQQAGMPGD